ncbi:homoserine dehydrogenase [Fulvivirgaceae bacterium BMA10]|uniref:Homoserine dehydrogenase n=1 Tax=Splendidivirga corallicola TaxID=3051826 RepID=A0ABT8KLI6_9BACT|nr:homoserine dehydrogenase [Fulvivirgaceae bacterium BMA10]
MSKKLRIGIYGFGVVGKGLYDIIHQNRYVDIEITKICVKDKDKKRSLPQGCFTFDQKEIIQDSSIDVIVELISEADEAYTIVSEALKLGKKVVTANKKMVAENLPELIEIQKEYGGTLLYEASCCGSIPVVRTFEDYLKNEPLRSIEGIFNGSSNYILSKIFNDGLSYDQALKEAQELGFAEADPTLDVGGFDAANKLCILATHAFGVEIHPEEVVNFGIQNLSQFEVDLAKSKHQKIKSLALAFRNNEDKIIPLVLPCFVEKDNTLFDVEYEYNAVKINAEYADSQLLEGKGAGAYPTGAAVLSDIIAIQDNYTYEYKKLNHNSYVGLVEDISINVYIRFEKEDILKNLGIDVFEEIAISGQERAIRGKVLLSKLLELKKAPVEDKILIAVEEKNFLEDSVTSKRDDSKVAVAL